MTTVYAQRDNLVKKDKSLLDELKWSDDLNLQPNLVKAFPCSINRRVTDDSGCLLQMMTNIYVDDILATLPAKKT